MTVYPHEVYLHMEQELVILYVDEVSREITFRARVQAGDPYYDHRNRPIKDHRPHTIPLSSFLDHVTKGFLKRVEP